MMEIRENDLRIVRANTYILNKYIKKTIITK